MKIITIEKLFVKLLIVASVLLMTACEKAVVEEENTTPTTSKTSTKSGKVNVTLRVAEFNFVPYTSSYLGISKNTRSVVNITDYCTRLNFVIYKEGKKVESRSQMKENPGFGETTMTLDAGDYQLLVLAHSSIEGNPILTDPENIQFTNKLGYSDTFYYYGNLTVTNEAQTHDILLTRASSLLQFVITDEFPSEVTHIYFKYTGGSGVLNAVTGYGANVNSQQEKKVSIKGFTAPILFKVWTFLKEDDGWLDVTVEARNANEQVLLSRQFADIPMHRNTITEYKGSFFAKEHTLNFTAETEWADTLHLTY
ncbi:MAG: hypothetical protein K6F89_05220 [Prevotella sp.]|nr:hypothetical protein [Prevotella sp.]